MITVARDRPAWGLWLIAVATTALAAVVLRLTFSGSAGDELTLPLWSLVLAAVWATGGIVLTLLTSRGRPAPDSLVPRSRRLLVVAVIAAVIAGGSFVGGLVLHAFPLTSAWIADALVTATSAPLLVTFVVALIAGAAEEIFFRLGFADLFTGIGRWVVPTLVYFAVTLASGNIALAIVAPILGIACTAAREWTGLRWAPIAVHAAWTVAMVLLFPLTLGWVS